MSKSTSNSAKYFAFSSGVSAGFFPVLISSILLFALSTKPCKTALLLSIPLSIITFIRFFAISRDLINVSSSEIHIEAFAFISAVQSVKVNAWSEGSVPKWTSIILPWKTFSPSNFSSI